MRFAFEKFSEGHSTRSMRFLNKLNNHRGFFIPFWERNRTFRDEVQLTG